MKIQLLSDTHFEFHPKPDLMIRPADVLILAGDIHVGKYNIENILTQYSPHYEYVLYCPGNHEYYDGSDLTTLNVPKNVHQLNPGHIDIQSTRFIGATLWTNFDNSPSVEFLARRSINDFRASRITSQQMKQMFYEHSEYIFSNVKPNSVIFTHFSPAIEALNPRFANSPLNAYFHNNLSSKISELPDVTWLFGHTHTPCDLTLGRCRLLSQPIGYPNELPPKEPLIIKI